MGIYSEIKQKMVIGLGVTFVRRQHSVEEQFFIKIPLITEILGLKSQQVCRMI